MNSPQFLLVLDAFGGIYRDDAEHEEAEPLYLRPHNAPNGPGTRFIGIPFDPGLAGVCLFRATEGPDADVVYRRLLFLWESSAGSDRPMVALTLD